MIVELHPEEVKILKMLLDEEAAHLRELMANVPASEVITQIVEVDNLRKKLLSS